MSAEKRTIESFSKLPNRLAHLLSAHEERFIRNLMEIDYLGRLGYYVDYTRAQYMKHMVMREYTFDECAKSLCRLGLVIKSADSGRNRVHYRMNEKVLNRLIEIVSITRNADKLTAFFDFHIHKLGKTIMELTDEDIESLRM